MNRGPNLTEDELRKLKDASDIKDLDASPGFKHIRNLLDGAVQAALEAIDSNKDPRLDTAYVNVWRERKFMRDVIERYIDGVRNNRREVVRSLLEELGFSPEQIEHNLDMDLEFLMEARETYGKHQ
jgi:hypothetical protein